MHDLCYGGPLATPHLLAGYREVAPDGLGDGAELRILANLLDFATRYLAREPGAHENGELWYSRAGTALTQLLRVSGEFPEWQAYLG